VIWLPFDVLIGPVARGLARILRWVSALVTAWLKPSLLTLATCARTSGISNRALRSLHRLCPGRRPLAQARHAWRCNAPMENRTPDTVALVLSVVSSVKTPVGKAGLYLKDSDVSATRLERKTTPFIDGRR
jgi:hypothetical protein